MRRSSVGSMWLGAILVLLTPSLSEVVINAFANLAPPGHVHAQ